MQAGLQARITQENWKNAAVCAGNLSEFSLTLGDIAQEQAYATQSVELADRSQDAGERMGKRGTLADEALTIATRGETGLHQADGHQAYARLRLAMGDTTKARESLATARAIVDRMGYHRRDAEVQELEEQRKRS
jgi:hypothetical protein